MKNKGQGKISAKDLVEKIKDRPSVAVKDSAGKPDLVGLAIALAKKNHENKEE